MYKSIMVFLLAALVMTSEAQAAGNEWNDSFSKAKKTLERQVYYDHRITLYCGAAFDEKKNVTLPELMDAWDKMYPVDAWECTRARRIERLQGNENPFVKERCQEAGL